ncbi:protein of unknown function [Cohnella sp. OV330]|uniref:DUF4362 domain-containing protein n=1 Tax=Cohnella sp. OV330 TaxID=1855288 RepID=UPI0008E2E47E|nr:DUF4362 domain-containing protein [Cohnella sp. OV330]SFB61701.1 protein of unknown function [Cohnella sp. OV330]
MRRRMTILAFASFVLLSACSSKPYSIEKASERGDVVDEHGEVKNAERLDTFYRNTLAKKKDKVRVTQLTTEGDPIFNDLEFNGKEIKYKYDNSEDKFGKPNIRKTTCKALVRSQAGAAMQYKLEGCYGANKEYGNRFMIAVDQETEVTS